MRIASSEMPRKLRAKRCTLHRKESSHSCGFSSTNNEIGQNFTIDKSSRSSLFATQLPHHGSAGTPNSSSTPVGRKRMMLETDEANNSQTAGSTASSALSSNVDIDSMRPVVAPRTKRRKTGILDAFNSISLVGPKKGSSSKNEMTETTGSTLSGSSIFGRKYAIPADQADDDADSSQAVAEADNVENSGDYYSSTGSSLGDDSTNDGDDAMIVGSGGDFGGSDSGVESEDRLLSDAELLIKKQERKVMLELVFGPLSDFVPQQDPVDVKIKQMIRKSLREHGIPAKSTLTTQSQDDMSLEYYIPSPLRSESASSVPRRNSLPGMSMPSPSSITSMQDDYLD